jgi:hypothetical protein
MKPTIDDIRSVQDFAVLYNWNLSFIQFPSGVLAPDPAGLNIRCQSADLPYMQSQDIYISVRGHQVFQPGIHTYAPISLEFQETEDNFVSTFVKSWRDLCWYPQTGIQRPKSELEAIVRLARLNRQGDEIWEYILVGCFPMDYSPGGPMSDQASDIMRIRLTLRFDYFTDASLL